MRVNLKKIGIISLAALILGVAIGIYFFIKVDTLKFEDTGFYPINGVEYPVAKGDKAVCKDGEVSIERKGESEIIPSEDLPFYYKDRNKICLMADMAYYKPDQQDSVQIRKLNYFTEIETSADTLLLSRGGKAESDEGGFLFNGTDTYIFLEETDLRFAGKKISLESLSYAVVCPNSWIMVYNAGDGKFRYEALYGNANAYTKGKNKYEVNLAAELLNYNEGEYMLNASVEYYSSYF